jgi:hypothetical protein
MVCFETIGAFNQTLACIGFKVTSKKQHSNLFQQAIHVRLKPSSGIALVSDCSLLGSPVDTVRRLHVAAAANDATDQKPFG